MLVYVEFISRRPSVSLEEFHRQSQRAQDTWAESHGVDRILLNAGRSWRIGPEPEYLCVWYTAALGLERIDEWEELFAITEEREHHNDFETVARIDRAGCYTPIGVPSVATEGKYLVEWLRFDDRDQDAVAPTFADRAGRHPETPLRCLARPLGGLAPGGLGFAVWGLSSWGAAHSLIADSPGRTCGIQVRDASLYADLGREQL